MPWRLIVFLVILTIVVLFAGFNISNAADISFGFYTIPNVPIFLSLFIAFLLGAFMVLPFVLTRRTAKGKPRIGRKSNQDEAPSTPAESPATTAPIEKQSEESSRKGARKSRR